MGWGAQHGLVAVELGLERALSADQVGKLTLQLVQPARQEPQLEPGEVADPVTDVGSSLDLPARRYLSQDERIEIADLRHAGVAARYERAT